MDFHLYIIPVVLVCIFAFLVFHIKDLNAEAKSSVHYFTVLLSIVFSLFYGLIGFYNGVPVLHAVTTLLSLIAINFIMAYAWRLRSKNKLADKS